MVTRKKILIVEDDFHSRVGLRDSLSHEGYEVETAANSLEAIIKMKDDINIGIFDLDLPVIHGVAITGWDLVGIFRTFHPHGSIIVVSAQDGYDMAAKAERWQITECLVKPIAPSRIKILVKACEANEDSHAVPATKQCVTLRKGPGDV